MPNQLADYDIVGAVVDDGVLPCLTARRPPRLGGGEGTISLWVLGPLARAPLAAARGRLLAAAAVRSPHLPQWLEAGAGEWAQRPVVFVSAATAVTGTLATGNLSPRDRVVALAAAARGAHALHEAGVLHGGICPQAVALSGPGPDNAVLAPPALADGKRPLVQVGYPPLAFVDPQLLRGNGGRWSDIWAIGATLRYLTSGLPPFPGKDEVPVVQALAQLLRASAPSPVDMPAPASELAQQCLSMDPAARPQTALEVADRLDQIGRQW